MKESTTDGEEVSSLWCLTVSVIRYFMFTECSMTSSHGVAPAKYIVLYFVGFPSLLCPFQLAVTLLLSLRVCDALWRHFAGAQYRTVHLKLLQRP